VRAIRRTAVIGIAAVAAATAMGTGTASAGTATGAHTVYVGPHAGGHGRASCDHPDASTVQQGVDRAATGGTVVVCAGTYKESVSITKKITLEGRRGSVIDATGQAYGVGIGADHVTVTGLTVKNANAPSGPADGIVTAAFGPTGPVPGNYARITDVVTTGNLGAGIDLNSTTGSLVAHSRSVANGIGINVADDLGAPSQDNRITDNVASDNKTGCGIALADHTGAGINRNLVWDNTADRNGLDKGGAGILIATPLGGAPGAPTATMKDNLIVGNEAKGNAHAGFELHIHAPGNTITGNRVVSNRFGTNNTLSDWQDTSTTGVFLGSNSPMSITVSHNTITGNVYGFYKAGPVDLHAEDNTFHGVRQKILSRPDYAG
jgi:parallel beta-helix repeat protein